MAVKIKPIFAPICDFDIPENRSGKCKWLADYTVTDEGVTRHLCGDHVIDLYGVDAVLEANRLPKYEPPKGEPYIDDYVSPKLTVNDGDDDTRMVEGGKVIFRENEGLGENHSATGRR